MYIETGPEQALAYLTDLANLEHWTLGTRVDRRVDPDTWVGRVTSARDPLYFHVRKTPGCAVPSFEWRIGREYGRYSAVHRLLIIPAGFAHPDSEEAGVYLHWLSFSNPARPSVLAAQGYDRIVHETESRNLKAVLERAHGLRAPACSSHRLCSASVYVDAPAPALAGYLGDLANAPQWAPTWRQATSASTAEAPFTDAYLQPFLARSTTTLDPAMALVDLHLAPDPPRRSSRIINAVLPCAHVFGDPSAPGCVLHRIAFAADCPDAGGPHDPRDLLAESFTIKRHAELLAGHPDSFAQGFSFPSPALPRG